MVMLASVAVSFLMHPSSLFVLGALLVGWVYAFAVRSGPLVVNGRELRCAARHVPTAEGVRGERALPGRGARPRGRLEGAGLEGRRRGGGARAGPGAAAGCRPRGPGCRAAARCRTAPTLPARSAPRGIAPCRRAAPPPPQPQ